MSDPSKVLCTAHKVNYVSGGGQYLVYQCIMYFFLTDARAVAQNIFGPGSGPTVYSNVRCNGNESSIMNCSYTSGGACTDAGVRCQRRLCKDNTVV